jgi:tetratricopeptide (TPR) repeat protein
MTDPATISSYPLLARAARAAEQGKFEQAAQILIQHLAQHPHEPRGTAELGRTAMRLGALLQAEHFLRKAMAGGITSIEIRKELASVLNQQERLDEANTMFAALEKESNDPGFPAVRAIILEKLGRHDEALSLRQHIVEQWPERPQHWIGYGHSLRAAGRVDEAIAAYRKAAEIDFEFGEAWWGLASIKRRIFTEDDIETMKKGLGLAIDERNSAPLHFAVARALHDRGQFEEAFSHYAEGNAQRAESLGYDASELTAEVDEVERIVDEGFVESLSAQPVDGATPIFIVCLPRSGSTLLEQMLGSHPEIEPAGELPYVPAILRSLMEMATRRGRITVPQAIARLSNEQAAAMGRDYLRRAALHRKTDRPFFTDKLPHNWSNILFIRRILPQARFIDIRRNALDCCFSNFTQSFSSAHASSFALRDIGQCYVDYVRMMAHLDAVAPGLVHHVRYEALIEQPQDQIGAVLDHVGVGWDPNVLEFHRLDRVIRTPSSEQVRRPLNREGMEVWKPFAEWLGPLRDALAPVLDREPEAAAAPI